MITEATPDDVGNEIEFVRQFITNSVPAVYFPLALIAYQEYLALLRMVQGSALLPLDPAHPTDAIHQQLKDYKNELLRFRLNYRFSAASVITMHNQAYRLWREAFTLDRMLEELSGDVQEVETFLDYEQRARQQEQQEAESLLEFEQRARQHERAERTRHYQTTLGILIGSLIFLTSLFGVDIDLFNGVEWLKVLAPDQIAGKVAAGVIIGGLVGAWWYIRRAFNKP